MIGRTLSGAPRGGARSWRRDGVVATTLVIVVALPPFLCYSHWVAQFGVRTISLSYEERPSTPDFPPPV